MLSRFTRAANELARTIYCGEEVCAYSDKCLHLAALCKVMNKLPGSLYAQLLLGEEILIDSAGGSQQTEAGSWVQQQDKLIMGAKKILDREFTKVSAEEKYTSMMADFFHAFAGSFQVPISSLVQIDNWTPNAIRHFQPSTSVFKAAPSPTEYLRSVQDNTLCRRWFTILLHLSPVFRELLALLLAVTVVQAAEDELKQLGTVTNNPAIHYDFTSIKFYAFEGLEERFCKSCITRHRASSQARRSSSKRLMSSVSRPTVRSRSTTYSVASSQSRLTALSGSLCSKSTSALVHSGMLMTPTAKPADSEQRLTLREIDSGAESISSARLCITFQAPPSDLSLSLVDLIQNMQQKTKTHSYLSLLKSSLQSMLSSNRSEREWQFPPITLVSAFEPFCELTMEGERCKGEESPELTYLLLSNMGLSQGEEPGWAARSLSFDQGADRTMFALASASLYDRLGEFAYSMDRKLARLDIAPILLVPAHNSYSFFVDRTTFTEKLYSWESVNMRRILKCTCIGNAHASNMMLAAASGIRARFQRKVPLEFTFIQLLLGALQHWAALKRLIVLAAPSGERKEHDAVQEVEKAVLSRVFAAISDYMRTTIEKSLLLQQHVPTLVLLLNSIDVLEKRFMQGIQPERIEFAGDTLSIRVYLIELLLTQLERFIDDCQTLTGYTETCLSSSAPAGLLPTIIAQPAAYTLGCTIDTVLHLQLDAAEASMDADILQGYREQIMQTVGRLLTAFFTYSEAMAKRRIKSEVDQLIRQLSEAHTVYLLIVSSTRSCSMYILVTKMIKRQIAYIFIQLQEVLVRRGIVDKKEQLDHLHTLKRSHMIHKQLLLRLENLYAQSSTY